MQLTENLIIDDYTLEKENIDEVEEIQDSKFSNSIFL